ncbi:MAG TPA: aminopeptidase P family protein [Polyangiaceae bacterium]|jgi:Xaa-Pro aminopeptidase|nr:aminopeptidase P family protein [Polyangiaceae bacterium]
MFAPVTVPAAFAARRQRLSAGFAGPALFVSGMSRPRNFAGNRYPFRAESHFLYFVGRAIEGAAVLIQSGEATLFAPRPDPEAELWSGKQPSLDELARELAIDVRPIDELSLPDSAATLPAQDSESSIWQSELVGRDIIHGSGFELEGADRKLAEAVIELRLEHDAAAVAQMRFAAAVADQAHRAGMRGTQPGQREFEVRARMEAAICAAGCACSYNSIVTVHGEVLHNERHDGLLEASDLLLADVGAETPEGWASDVTRVWPARGEFSSTQRELYGVVLASQLAAIAAVRPGVRYLAVHRAAGLELLRGLIALGIFRGDLEDLYARGAAALFFPHGVGHLLGLDVHDMEDLGDRAGYAPGRVRSENSGDRYLRLDRDLRAGMAVTIEPGFYQIPALLSNRVEVGGLESALDRKRLAEFADVRGIRIEDDVLVTEDGCDVLTGAIPKTIAEVEAALHA